MAQTKTISTELRPLDKFLDTSGDAGTSGQILSSTASGINWINNTGLGGTVTGTGTATRVAFWDTTTSITSTSASASDLFWDNTNTRLGIATATPQKRVHIEGTGGASEMQVLVSSASDTVGHTAGIGLRSEGGEADGDFRIKGGIFFERIAGSFGNGKMILAVNSSVSNTSVTVADHAITIDTNKNVGIGTTTPELPLEVNGSILVDVFAATQTEEGIFFRPGYTATNKYNLSILAFAHESIPSFNDGLSINGYDGISFCTGSNARNEQMRITFDGDVGIGIISPPAKLAVKDSSDSGFDSGIAIIRSANSQTGYINMVGGAMNMNSPSIPITFRMSGVERMRISSAGAVKFNAYGEGTLISDTDGNITVSSGGGEGGPYLPLSATSSFPLTGDLLIDKNSPLLDLGKLGNTTGNAKIRFFSKAVGGGGNAFAIQFNKNASADRLEFLDGSGNPNFKFNNGGSSAFAGSGTFGGNVTTTASLNGTNEFRVTNSDSGNIATARFIAISDSGNIQLKAISSTNTTYGSGDVGVLNCDTMSNGFKIAHNDVVKYTLTFAGENTWTGGGIFKGSNGVELLNGTGGTSSKLLFRNSDNNDASAFIRKEAYWMQLSAHQNEGFKFTDTTNSTILLQLNGGNSSSGNGINSATFLGDIIGPDNFKATGSNMKFFAGGTHVFNVDVNRNIYPNTHNSTDLGFSAALAFRQLYLSGNISSTAGATFTGLVSGITPTASANFTTKDYVDGVVSGATRFQGTWNASMPATVNGAVTSSTVLEIDLGAASINNNITVGTVIQGADVQCRVTTVNSNINFTVTPAISVADGVTLTLSPNGGIITGATPGTAASLTTPANQVTGNYYICEANGLAEPNAAVPWAAVTEPNSWAIGDWVIFSDLTTDAWQKIDNSTVLSGSGVANQVAVWSDTESLTGSSGLTVSGENLSIGGNVTAARGFFNSGATNVVATFTSTDGIAGIGLIDNGGSVELSASGDVFQVQPAGGAAQLTVGASTSTFAGNVTLASTDPVLKLDASGSGNPEIFFARLTDDDHNAKIILGTNQLRFENAGDPDSEFLFQGRAVGSGSLTDFLKIEDTGIVTTGGVFTGDVGIGTNDPRTQLEIFNSGTSVLTMSHDGGGGSGSRIDFNLNNAGVSEPVTAQIKATDDGAFRSDIIFTTKTSASGSSGLSERMRIEGNGNVGIATDNPFSKLQIGAQTFTGGNGMFANSRVGISNHGNLTGMMLASTYDDPGIPEYGLVFVQGPTTSSYNVWSISPDGPARGSGLSFIYQSGATNIHNQTPKVYLQGSSGFVGIGTVAPLARLHTSGSIFAATNVIDADVNDANPNLLDQLSIKIANKNDIYANTALVAISEYEATYTQDGTAGGASIRLSAETAIAVGGTFTFSVYYKDLVGNLAIDIADTSVTGIHTVATGTSGAPASGRIYGTIVKPVGNPYSFVDINITSGTVVTLLNPKLEIGGIPTKFVATTEKESVPQTLTVNNINTTGKLNMLGLGSNTGAPSAAITLALVQQNQLERTFVGTLTFPNSGAQTYHYNLVFPASGMNNGFGFDVSMVTARGLVAGTGSSGNWRNFFYLKDSSYIYTEQDADFTAMAQGPLDLINNVAGSEASLPSLPTGFLSDSPTATSLNGSSPYQFFIKRYSIALANNTTGGNGFIQIVVKTTGYIGDIITFDQVQ